MHNQSIYFPKSQLVTHTEKKHHVVIHNCKFTSAFLISHTNFLGWQEQQKTSPTFSFTTSYAQIFATGTLFAVKKYPETEIKEERKK